MPTVVWLIQNMVPYHHARFEAFASVFDGDAHLVQLTDKDSFGVLEFTPDSTTYHLHTLFPGRNRTDMGKREIDLELAAVLGEVRPDCVCVSGWGMAIGQSMLGWALAHKVPSVMFSESTAYDERRAIHKEWVKKMLVRSTSAALVGGTPHRAYIGSLGMPSEAVFDGHNVVDSAHFALPFGGLPDEFPEELAAEAYFAVCTRFGRKKNLPLLVQGYVRYVRLCDKAGLRPIKLVVGGDGETRTEVEAAIDAGGLHGKVLLLGSISYGALPWFYQNCEAFVHASTTEQWGLVVNEAMAAGAPLLLSRRCGCAPDLLEEGANGFGFDPFSVESIAETLFRFTKLDGSKRAEFGQCSRERIQEWGTGRFGKNLEAAVEHAVKVGAPKNTILAQLLLATLGK